MKNTHVLKLLEKGRINAKEAAMMLRERERPKFPSFFLLIKIRVKEKMPDGKLRRIAFDLLLPWFIVAWGLGFVSRRRRDVNMKLGKAQLLLSSSRIPQILRAVRQEGGFTLVEVNEKDAKIILRTV